MKADDFYLMSVPNVDGGEPLFRLMTFTGGPVVVKGGTVLLEIKEARALASFILESLDKYEASLKKG